MVYLNTIDKLTFEQQTHLQKHIVEVFPSTILIAFAELNDFTIFNKQRSSFSMSVAVNLKNYFKIYTLMSILPM